MAEIPDQDMNYGPSNAVIELLGARLAQDEVQDYGYDESSNSVESNATENDLNGDLTHSNNQQGQLDPTVV